MKVFEVLFDYSIGDEKEITREVVYWSGDFESVSKHAIEHAFGYEKELIGIRDVLTITRDCGLSDETE